MKKRFAQIHAVHGNIHIAGFQVKSTDTYKKQALVKGEITMVDASRIQEISDRLEIEDLFTRYCTAIDSKQFDDLDSVFTPDAFIDYTSAGGVKGTFPEVKKWLSEVLSLFPMTQHSVTNFAIKIEGDHATSRCAFYNPMGVPRPEGEEGLKLYFFGGYYNDTLIRTDDGWRISQRIEESTWNDVRPGQD